MWGKKFLCPLSRGGGGLKYLVVGPLRKWAFFCGFPIVNWLKSNVLCHMSYQALIKIRFVMVLIFQLLNFKACKCCFFFIINAFHCNYWSKASNDKQFHRNPILIKLRHNLETRSNPILCLRCIIFLLT